MQIFILSNYKSMATRVFIALGQKQYYSSPLRVNAICKTRQESASWLQRCRLKMLTTEGRTTDEGRRTDKGRTTDDYLYYKLTYEPLAQVS